MQRFLTFAIFAFAFACGAPARAEQCATVGACVMDVNVSSGEALKGVSNAGFAITGISNAQKPPTKYGIVAGVHGVTTTTVIQKAAGVFGESQGEVAYGVIGRGYGGVVGIGNEAGIIGFAPGSNSGNTEKGVVGSGATGVVGEGTAAGRAGVFGYNFANAPMFTTSGITGFGLDLGGFFLSSNIGILGEGQTASSTAVQAEGSYDSILFRAVQVSYPTNKNVMSVDGNGNMILAGTLVQQGVPLSRVASHGDARIAYGMRSSRAVIEDFGETTLTNGTAVVRMDPSFASSIDTATPYLVFITLEDDTVRPLFVQRRTATGFTVVEGGHVRESASFAYRIVASAADGDGRHLPAASAAPQFDTRPLKTHTMTVPPPLRDTFR